MIFDLWHFWPSVLIAFGLGEAVASSMFRKKLDLRRQRLFEQVGRREPTLDEMFLLHKIGRLQITVMKVSAISGALLCVAAGASWMYLIDVYHPPSHERITVPAAPISARQLGPLWVAVGRIPAPDCIFQARYARTAPPGRSSLELHNQR